MSNVIVLVVVSAVWFAAGYHRGKRRALLEELEWIRAMNRKYPRP
jgi:hypothetical protein